jgi:hypothetical protein
MAQSEAHTSTVFVSRFNRVLAIVIWVIAVALLVATLAGGGQNAALAFVPAAFVALLTWTAMWRPYVHVDDSGVRLRNVVRTVDVPWEALIHVDTRYALTLFTPGHRYSAWAAPAPGRTGTAMAQRAENHGRVGPASAVDGRVRTGDLLGSESGQAAHLVRERWSALLGAGAIEPGVADTARVAVRWHSWLIVALVVLAAGSVWSLILL